MSDNSIFFKTTFAPNPFGSPMDGRAFSGDKYRFGFNGKTCPLFWREKESDIAGDGNHNTALFWEYDTRFGRRWNLDPKPNPSISDYACFGNNPVLNCDPKGDTLKMADNQTEEFKKAYDDAIKEIKSTKRGLELYNNLKSARFFSN